MRRLAAHTTFGLSLMAAAVQAVAADAPTVPDAVSFALVVGSNNSPTPDLEALRYADDDAIGHARTLSMLGVETTLLVSPDAETRELFPQVKTDGVASGPSVRAAFQKLATRIQAARAAGRATRLYFFFAGHGDVMGGRPFLELDDGRFFREDLATLLRAAHADENHVVVDACYSALFVGVRGPGGERERLEPGFSRAAGPGWPARTGFLTARSSGGQTHEWSEFQAGIFSHETRSGLSGAADADLDGRITYRELAAFVARANASIPNRKYRPEVLTTPPDKDLDAILAVLPSGPMVLDLDVDPVGRTFVETERGVRLVDLHGAPGNRVKLRLPTDMGWLYVQRESPRAEFKVAPQPGYLALSALTGGEPRARARGAAHEAFRKLFALPFDRGAVSAFAPEAELDVRAELDAASSTSTGRTLPRWPGWALAGVGCGLLGGSAGFGLSAYGLAHEADGLNGMQRAAVIDSYQQRVDERNRMATVLGISGAIVLGAGIAWLLWPSRD